MQFAPLEENIVEAEAADDNEEDALADAVVELNDKFVTHEEKIDQLATNSAEVKHKLHRAEAEIQNLKFAVAELKKVRMLYTLECANKFNAHTHAQCHRCACTL